MQKARFVSGKAGDLLCDLHDIALGLVLAVSSCGLEVSALAKGLSAQPLVFRKSARGFGAVQAVEETRSREFGVLLGQGLFRRLWPFSDSGGWWLCLFLSTLALWYVRMQRDGKGYDEARGFVGADYPR